MPTYITREHFTCKHVAMTCRGTSSGDDRVIQEDVTTPVRCLKCVSGEILHTVGSDELSFVSGATWREMEFHLLGLWRSSQTALSALADRVSRPRDREDFRVAIFDLVESC